MSDIATPATLPAPATLPTAAPVNEARIREVLAHSPLLTDADFAHLAATANTDAHEGADWLPYYKTALGLLMNAFGALDVAAREALRHAAGIQELPTDKWAAMKRVMDTARGLARLSLRPCGIGPDTSIETAAHIDALTDRSWPVDAGPDW